jgi:arylsulfatase A-like enzyme
MIAWPGVASGTCSALTTNVDVHATLLDLFGVRARQRTHGRSLAPLLRGETTRIRDWALSGYWGREVHVIDGVDKYARGPVGANVPLSVFSNRWSTMPVARIPQLRMPLPDERARLDRMPGSKVPVIRQPFGEGDRLPFWAMGQFGGSHLWNLREDPNEDRNLAGTPAEKRAEELLRAALVEIEAPDDQLTRLGLA